ncbi:dienelactone hydrolase family protein [Govanella unica]|uniref:Dienelactone hydrolase family protein n=1 Tax=Govanella unica TaxID=2975056 RepID=A0A9X3TVN0_9PROT|nr:dienelactone hydrolase family protein [Govania unica]MDA5192384.1 dienelactone hydrolase family protein [Govania unica]
MSGQDITIASKDGNFSGYLATPAGGRGPGVLVIQEIFGINANIRAIADNLATRGYFALAPDLFWRQEPGIQLTPNTQAAWDKAFELYRNFNVDKGVEDLITSLDHLRALPGSSGKVGCQGYCLGGLLAYLMAARSDVDAAVGYHGVGIDSKLSEAKHIHCPLMLHIASADAFVDTKAQAAIHAALNTNPYVILHDYAGADHAFTREGGDHYNKKQADLANQRTAEFLAGNLKG